MRRRCRPAPWRLAAGALALTTGLALALAASFHHRASPPARPGPVPAEPFILTPGQVPDPPPGGGGRLAHGPDRLVIPSLRVSAPLAAARVINGALDLPDEIAETVRWDGSADLTATRGAVLVAGHLDNADRDPGALHRLWQVRPGAAVFVVEDHRVTRWKVTGLVATPKARLPAELWSGPLGPRRLYLVTCGGPILAGHYVDNVVATAVPVAVDQPGSEGPGPKPP